MSRTGEATWGDLKSPGTFWLGAHRGGRDLGPENTLETAELGFQAGAAFWELDVQLSADDVAVVIHDGTLERTTDAPWIYPNRSPWRVADFLWDELSLLTVLYRMPDKNRPSAVPFPRGSRTDRGGCSTTGEVGETPARPEAGSPALFPSRRNAGCLGIPLSPPPETALKDPSVCSSLREQLEVKNGAFRIPSLRRALEWTRARGWLVNVEIKVTPGRRERLVRETVSLIREFHMGPQVLVSSFDREVLRLVKALEPSLTIGVLLDELVPDPVSLVRSLQADTVHPAEAYLREDMVRRCRAADIPVIAWTVNDPERAKDLKAWGVSAVISDRPHRLVPYLGSKEDPS